MTSDDLAARGVRVKALEWSNHYATMMATYTEAIQATAFGLQYRIFFAPEDGGDWYAIAVMPDGKRVGVDTLEAAKAAAQADYEARILAALEVSDE